MLRLRHRHTVAGNDHDSLRVGEQQRHFIGLNGLDRFACEITCAGVGAGASDLAGKTVKPIQADEVALLLTYAQRVVIVPGYGMAVAQAQHSVRELSDELGKRGIEVQFAIHPVAGRMPGHMNVLLAEANVPYDQLIEMEAINPT